MVNVRVLTSIGKDLESGSISVLQDAEPSGILTGFVIARKAWKKSVVTVIERLRPDVGFRPAAIIANTPERDISRTLKRPIQLSRSKVRGSDRMRVAAAKISRKYMAQRALSDNDDKACCPDSNSEPYRLVWVHEKAGDVDYSRFRKWQK
jgi:hypothetical protein